MSEIEDEARRVLEESRDDVPGGAPKVPCPSCGGFKSRVMGGQSTLDGYRRQRECTVCETRFTTIERFNKIVRRYRNRHI